ncbi:unnamed protein product [Caenorhabditis sp. 36 PRJEB53466]|nr:unnamed protein product [Caenorhabditis sp. 36 PRJEB53466]
MSANWDDSDSENDNVVVEEKPLILPRARQPSIAKSLEKVQILENSVAGSEKNASDDDSDASSVMSDDLENIGETTEVLNLSLEQLAFMKKNLAAFQCNYKNIISEFADVEIFLISVDSLIVECAAHSYHNWDVAGQSIVLNKQIDRFLQQFVDIGGRFKLVVFSDLTAQFAKDTTLSFARSAALAHLASGPHARDLLFFTNPTDSEWDKLLNDLTPSFLMISTDNVTPNVCASQDIDLTKQFETIALDVLTRSMSVVLLHSIKVNFASVEAYYIQPRLVIAPDWPAFLAAHWENNSILLRNHLSKEVKFNQFETLADLWAKVILDAKATGKASDSFDTLAAAVLLSSLICTRRGPHRIYYPDRTDAKRGLNVIRDRRLILNAAVVLLDKADHANSKLDLTDLWDGRMVYSIFDELNASVSVLPYRLQEEFAKYHQKAGLTVPLATDTAEKLFDPLPEITDPLLNLPILYSVTSPMLKRFVPETEKMTSQNAVEEGAVQDYAEFLKDTSQWRLKPIEETYAQKEEKIEDAWQLKRANRAKQFLMRWYELFANSLEGRGSNLLVDFSRVPKGFATVEEEVVEEKKTGKGGWSGQKQQKPGAGGKKGVVKDAGKSKKDMILEANKKAKDQKLAESEKVKIKYGCQQGKGVHCVPEQPLHLARSSRIESSLSLRSPEKQEARRSVAIDLVGHIKDCFMKHWEHLEPKQKEQIVDLWVSLGFDAPAGSKPSSEAKQKKLNLGINMIYYQLQYGGELIDIQSDPKKDDRVSGFAPDGWQRKMLDAVDRGNSALIIAPTSAGKTFVSYYCIEKVLRASDNDVVVYVAPSKALINQVCGSVYARFRNKSMKRGMSLFGTLTQEYSQNAMQCQVLITVPECLQELMLSRTPAVQKFVSHINEQAKSSTKRKVELINYGERYSELELSILNINDPHGEEGGAEHKKGSGDKAVIPLMPYGVYMPEKLRMFSIPEDQQLTAKQILHLYNMMVEVDPACKKEFEPCTFFGQHGSKAVWISRSELRRLEKRTEKKKFMEARPFNKEKVANDYVVTLVDELRDKGELPAICFNDDRHVCEKLATTLANELERRELEYMETDEFKTKYMIKDESKLVKQAKRKRDEAEKKKKGDKDEDAGPEKEDDEMDVLAMKKARLARVLERFKLRGRNGGDSDLYAKMTERMQKNAKNRESTQLLLKLFERGIGFHHAGLNTTERGAVEVLFRSGNLAVLFSTSTLSLGVNMPCKTVMFGVDTLQLTPLLYRQMSGRAGRRGFDHSGNVIFMSIPTSKIRRLLTASLSNLQGNPPFTVIFLLRLFAYVHQQDILDDEGQKVSTMKQRAFAAKSLLEHSFSLHTRREASDGVLQKQLRMFSAFSFQLLRHMQLLSPFGEAKNFAEMAIHSSAGASGTLLFIYLMQKKCFHQLLKKIESPEQAQLTMLEILANLFTNVRMAPFHERNDALESVHVQLRGLPADLIPFVKEYNETVTGLYKRFMAASSKDGSLFDQSFTVSGKLDSESVSLTEDFLVAPLFDQYSHDESFLPVLDFDKKDHRGRKIQRNAFAYDFFVHGSRKLLCEVNTLNVSTAWFQVHDFASILERLAVGVHNMARPQDPLVLVLEDLAKNYDENENDNVVVEEKPLILSRARQPSIAKSLEKVQILENSVAGSEKNASDDDSDASSMMSDDLENIGETTEVLNLSLKQLAFMKKNLAAFQCNYKNIISEFADVEIFLISVDSLIVECAAHSYHNWDVAGQSIVLNKQIDRFLQQFVDIGGRFKLVVFSDLTAQFAKDTTLSFARSAALAHLASGPHARDLLFFTNPTDSEWDKLLNDLTPSFLMISTDNVTPNVCASQDIDLTKQFETIALDVLTRSMSVVLLHSIKVNFASVEAYYIQPRLFIARDWPAFLAAHWENNSILLRNHLSKEVKFNQFETLADLWAKVILDAKATGKASDSFDTLAAAVLLSSLICTRRGPHRIYYPDRTDAKRGLNVIRDRRLILNAAVVLLDKADHANSKLDLTDLWDGRMVYSIFDELNASVSVLPYRLQEEFAKYHQKAGLTVPLATDTAEKLFDPLPEITDPLLNLPILYSVTSPMLKRFVPETEKMTSQNAVEEGAVQDYAEFLKDTSQWRLKPIEETYAQKEEKIEDAWQLKRANRAKQFLMRWYELFANSLEGRGSNLLVDFSRVPKGFATVEEEVVEEKKTGKGGWSGQKQQKPGAGGKKGVVKDAGKSKKDMILEANKKAKDQKLAESEKVKIKYGCQQGKESIVFLNNLYTSLDLPESKALCRFEVTVREGRILFDHHQGPEKQEARRSVAIDLVGHIKDCFMKHWEHLEPKQKEQIVDLWVSLGFDAPAGSKPSSEAKQKKLNLGINMIYYQLQYGGELIDIQSDPKKDDRVSGFAPDGWQRKMLDAVDRGNSALIIAPTSAGKTFVSYYCIEKVLRASDNDVVVYVAPSKALINQVCGSVYARFRNKSMKRGMSLFGTLTQEYSQNAMQCQVLITVPECLQELMLSRTPAVQKFVSHIKYVVFDEVHSIGASEESHIWEQLLLLIQCPFLALSATIGNADKLHEWLNSSEQAKSSTKRKVELINYGERYSELELSILNINDPHGEEGGAEHKKGSGDKAVIPLMPYGVYMPEKLRMFSIPEDQQLTAKQILHLYNMMAEVDPACKKEFEPCTFFGQHGSKAVWISRSELRRLENALKKKFMEWLTTDEQKINSILKILKEPVNSQLTHRARPFNKEKVANDYVVTLVDELRDKGELPAICFNDDRHVCEKLATTLANELERRELEYMETDEFKTKYMIKDESKLVKQAKKKRDEPEKKKKGDKDEDAGPEKEDDEMDVLAIKKAILARVLERFKLRGRNGGDSDLYAKMTERMQKNAKNRESTQLLLKLFERGIGFHHAGLNTTERGAVEVLFRSGNLAVLFSTSTLSLGVNMPCKTVMFGVDTLHLTPLLYRQMSGRAGRRGFDHSGNVIFMSIPTSKIRRLLTASLSNLQGNPPFTVIFLLRLFAYVHQQDILDDEGQKVSTMKQRDFAAKSLLEHSFSLHTRREASDGVLQKQLRMFSAFSFQLLRHMQLLSPFGEAKNFAEMAIHSSAGASGTLLFIYLMQKKCFHQLLEKIESPEQAQLTMLEILANLFTNVRMAPFHERNDALESVHVQLRGLPADLIPFVKEYNETVTGLYKRFMAASSKDGSLFDQSFTVSGKLDSESVSLTEDFLVAPLFDQYSHDESFLPVLDFDKKDHRGRKIQRNAFAYDFFVHGSRKLLCEVNILNVSTAWFQVHNFASILERLAVGVHNMARPQDPLVLVLEDLAKNYDEKVIIPTGFEIRVIRQSGHLSFLPHYGANVLVKKLVMSSISRLQKLFGHHRKLAQLLPTKKRIPEDAAEERQEGVTKLFIPHPPLMTESSRLCPLPETVSPRHITLTSGVPRSFRKTLLPP